MIIVATFILIIFVYIRILKVRMLSPDGLLLYTYSFYIFGSFITLKNRYTFYYTGIIWLLFALLIFSIGFRLIANSLLYENSRINVLINKEEPVISWKVLNLFTFISLISVVLNILKYGFEISSFFNFDSLQKASQAVTIERYSGNNADEGIIFQIINSFLYVTPVCAGYSLIYAKEKIKKVYCIVTLIPVIITTVITTAKLALMSYLLLFFSGFYVSYLYRYKVRPKFNLSQYIRYIILLSVVMVLMIFSFVLRIGVNDPNLVKLLIDKISEYAFGHIQGFDVWFNMRIDKPINYGWGINSFLSLSSKLHLIEKKQGIYDIVPLSSTNIYTPFRALIEDYGIFLSLLIMFFLGAFIAYVFHFIQYGHKNHVSLQWFGIIAIFQILYYMISIWTYTMYIVAFIFIFFYLKFIFYYSKRNLS